MHFLLDDKKVYMIIGVAFAFWLFIYLLPNKKNQTTDLIPITTQVVVDYQPKYFNKDIYSMPNARADPYVLYGSQYPTNPTNLQVPGFERLLPIVENLPTLANMRAFATVQINQSTR